MHKINKYVTKEQLKYITYTIIALIVIGIIIGAISLTLYILNSLGYIVLFLDWIGEIGYYGNAVMIICIIIVNFPFMMGYGSLMIASGFLFGFKLGLLTVVIGCQIGVFFVGLLIRIKYFREKSEEYINSKPYVKAMMEELILHKLKFAFLIRMSPIPLGVQNLVLSLSGMPMWQYMVTSFFGLIIEQAPLVYIGSTLMDITQIFTGEATLGWEQVLVIIISAIAIILLIVFLFFVTKRAFSKVKARELELKKKAEEEQNEEISIELSTVSADEKGESAKENEHEIGVGDGEDLVVEYEGAIELNDYPIAKNDDRDDQKIDDNDIKIVIDNGDDHFIEENISNINININNNSIKNKIKNVISKNKENKKREIEEEVEIEIEEYRPTRSEDDVEDDLGTEMEMEYIPQSSYPIDTSAQYHNNDYNNNNNNNINNNFDENNVNNNNINNNNIDAKESGGESSEFTEVRDDDQNNDITVNFDFNQFNGDDNNNFDDFNHQTISTHPFDYSYPSNNNDGEDDDDHIYQFNPSNDNDNDDNEML